MHQNIFVFHYWKKTIILSWGESVFRYYLMQPKITRNYGKSLSTVMDSRQLVRIIGVYNQQKRPPVMGRWMSAPAISLMWFANDGRATLTKVRYKTYTEWVDIFAVYAFTGDMVNDIRIYVQLMSRTAWLIGYSVVQLKIINLILSFLLGVLNTRGCKCNWLDNGDVKKV